MFKKILVLLIIFLPLPSFAEAPEAPEAPEVKELKEIALVEIGAAVSKAGDAVALSYLNDNMAKYLTGGEVGFVFQGKYSIDKCEKVRNPNPPYHTAHLCTKVLNQDFPYSNFRSEVEQAGTELFKIPFKYSLKTSIRSKISPNVKGFRAYIGTTKDEPYDPINSELIGDRIPINKNVQRGKYYLNINGTVHFTIYSYIRTKLETLHEIKVTSSDNRVTSGELTLDRLGPGVGQTDINIVLPIIENKGVDEITDIITGDYLVKLSNAFCGCSYILNDDHVVDTYKGEGSNKAIFQLPELVEATVEGRLVARNLSGELFPVENTELMLKPACEDADECMGQVEKVKTDSDGHFEFKDVPKGGYEIFHRDLKLKSVLNCEAASTAMDVGDIEIELDPIYTVDVRYSSPNHLFLSAAHVQWKHVTIDPVENDKWVLFAGQFGDDQFPIDTEGYPITVPFKTAYPGAPYSEIIWGEAMFLDDVVNSELKSITTGPYTTNGCSLYEEPWLSLIYRDKPQKIPPFKSIPRGHHLELSVPIECYFKMVDLPPGVNGGMPHSPVAPTNKSAESTFWVNPNTPLDYGESHFSQFKLTVIPDAVIKALTEGKGTQFTLTRDTGEKLVIKFIREAFPESEACEDTGSCDSANDDFDSEFESKDDNSNDASTVDDNFDSEFESKDDNSSDASTVDDNFDSEFESKDDNSGDASTVDDNFDSEFESKDGDENGEGDNMSPPDVGGDAYQINEIIDLFSELFGD
ncbi:hypothetical protein Q4508_17505 [Amphritea sp. 2_MG-2023]|uniref:hypothetical protein n=1 Tax=Amphritea sp. 2_MG-2023 TaxID=3062682 RepID=UPI0026E2B1C3|nr:hypothetical protein [Amphritea sp. 2_MG-2023]MDO6420355.1 hypothetical protein [Amphritea sp. 2_MG-2023]